MPSIDERVVAMSFENAKFEAGVAQTMATLSKLNAALAKVGTESNLGNIEAQANKVTLQQPMSALDKLRTRLFGAGEGAAQGLGEIERAGSKVTLEQPMSALDRLRARLGSAGAGASESFNEIEKASDKVVLRHLTSALDNVTAKFSVLQGAASVALGNIASQAGQKGASFAKSFSFGPIQQGFEEYQTNLGSIQTIMANTEGQRISGLRETNKHLQELNHYSDQTIYNFSQMAKNIGTFTAAGVDLETSTQSIKGIANLAALSGSSAQQASTAMYQLSQAIAAGRVGLQDWNSVVNAGMGGRKFQNSLIQTGVAMGTIEEGAVKIDKATGKATINGQSFRESIMAAPGKESWLTSDVLTGSLEQFTGDMSDAELKAKGFTEAQIKSIQATAQTAKKAATEVKTLPQVFDVAKEAIGSGWAKTFQNVFGNFTEAKKLFTGVSESINGIINRNADVRNKILGDWKKLGGRSMLIEGIKNIFEALGQVLGTVKNAFRDIFPRKTGEDLLALTKRFKEFTENLKSSPQTLENLRKTFKGFFAVLSIGWYVVKKIAGVIFDLLGIVRKGSGGFLNFTGSIGEFLTGMQKAIVKGDALGGFFKGLTNILRAPLEILRALGSAFGGLFAGVDPKKAAGVGDTVSTLADKLGPLENIIKRIGAIGKSAINTINHIFEPFSKAISGMGKAITGFGEAVARGFQDADFDRVFQIIQTALVGGIFLAIKKALGQPINLIGGITGTLDRLKAVLSGLTGTLKGMQQGLQATTLLAIAVAIGTLAAGITVLSKIDPKKLTTAMTGVAIGLGELIGALGLLSAVTKGTGGITLGATAFAMIELAAAVTLLGLAMKIFASMNEDEMTRGLVGVAGSLTAIGLAMKFIGPSITISAPGILAVALAMNVLGVAMKIFGSMSWDEIARGIVGVGGSLLAMGLGVQAVGPSILLIGPGLIAAALGLTLLSGAVSSFGGMDLGDLIKGILGIGAALLVLGTTMGAIPPTIALQAAGLLVAAVALTGVAGAVKAFGSMDLGTLIKGILAIGAALLVLAVGLTAMIVTLPGSVALLAAAAAFAVLVPVIGILGTLSWATIGKGLAAIAGTLLVLGVVGAVAATGLIALGVGLGAVGLGVTIIGAGIYLIVKALILLGDASIKSTGVLIAAITAFIVAIPRMAIEFVKGLVQIVAEIAKIAPQVVDALVKIINSLLDVIIKATPKIQEVVNRMLEMFVDVITTNSGPVIAAGLLLLLNFLRGVDENIGEITTRVGNIITKFLTALARKLPGMITAGAKVIVAFLQGIASKTPRVVAAAAHAITVFLTEVGKHVDEVTASAINIIVKFAVALLNGAWRLVKAGIKFVIKVLDGIAEQIPEVRKAAVHLVRVFLNNLVTALVSLAHIAFTGITRFMNSLAREIRDHKEELWRAGKNLAFQLLDGFTFGLAGKARDVKNKIENIFGGGGGIAKAAKKALKSRSPSRVFMEIGDNVMIGFALGIQGGVRSATATMGAAAKEVVGQAQSKFGNIDNLLDGVMDVDPVISPVLDLSQVESEAKKLSGLTNVTPITAAASYGQASAISSEQRASETARAEAVEQARVELKFEQNNTSPEALSDREIYRRTRNQLSQAKNVLQGVGGFAQVTT